MMNKSKDKLRLFALIEPLNIRMSLCFPSDGLISDIHNFIDDTMRKYTIKYRVGRVEWNGAWILPQFRIEDFLEDKSEITVYSVEYGVNLKSLASERDRLHVNYSVFDQDVNAKFIAKKTLRDQKNKRQRVRENSRKTTEVVDEEGTNPPTSSMEPLEDLNLENVRNRDRELLPPKDVQRKDRDQRNDKHDGKHESKHDAKHDQKQGKKKGDETPTRGSGETSGNKNKSNMIKRQFSGESESDHEDDSRKKQGKQHKTPENKKQYSREEQDDSEEDLHSDEDLQYPTKTRQPLDQRGKK